MKSWDYANSVTIDVLTSLQEVFGSSTNAKGFEILHPSVGTLWGDGIDYQGIRGILYTMRNQGWAANNIIFGCGGGILQKLNRDTQRFAFKCSSQTRDGEDIDIFKRPLDASKTSKKGRLSLINENGIYKTVQTADLNGRTDHLEVVFENGVLLRDMTFDQCRKNTGNW